MSADIETNDVEVQEPVQDERDSLKSRATMLGIDFKANIPTDKLRELVNDKLNSAVAPVDKAIPGQAQKEETVAARNARLRKEASRLVRVRVSCMNPAKKEWEGEIFTVSNSAIGTFKKFVPFDNEEGWHIPEVIYKMILGRKCQIFTTTKNSRGQKIRQGKLIKEFAVEVLPDLTPRELEQLARKQAMAKGQD